MRLAIIGLVALALAACVTENPRISETFTPPTERTRIVVMKPDVEMSLLTAGGLQEPRADWTSQAEDNYLAAFEQIVRDRGHDVVDFDADIDAADRQTQLILLHDAVGGAILSAPSVPTKAENFDWTLGNGAAELSEAYDADLALFVIARGSYASGGRVTAAVVSAALFGVAPPLGTRVTIASLVDLNTGEVVWMDMSLVGDPRDAENAQSIVETLADDIPL